MNFFLQVIFTLSKKNVLSRFIDIFIILHYSFNTLVKLQHLLYSYGEKDILVSISVSQRTALINQYIYQYSILRDRAASNTIQKRRHVETMFLSTITKKRLMNDAAGSRVTISDISCSYLGHRRGIDQSKIHSATRAYVFQQFLPPNDQSCYTSTTYRK